jgi:hypothetical protein
MVMALDVILFWQDTCYPQCMSFPVTTLLRVPSQYFIYGEYMKYATKTHSSKVLSADDNTINKNNTAYQQNTTTTTTTTAAADKSMVVQDFCNGWLADALG